MKKAFFAVLTLMATAIITNAQNTILEARQMPVGSVVTVKGIATNGSEMGIIRYFEDGTAGIAAYGSLTNPVNRGDSITVTGTLKIYNQLLELDPLTSVVVRSTGNPLPEPLLLTVNQIEEAYEGRLVQIHDVLFYDAGQTFTGNKKYTFSSNGEIGYVYIKNGQDFVGTTVPSGPVHLTAICSQFDYNDPNAGYQLLPRDLNDIFIPSSIYLTGSLDNPDFTQTTLDFSWETNIAGTTEMFYGGTEAGVFDNHISVPGTSTTHNVELTGLNPGEIVWVKAFSVSNSDTAFSSEIPFATISNSSGDIKVYFNTPVDHDYSNGVDAIYLYDLVDDTLINYINRAKYTIDFTMYNFNNNGISNISNALKSAANRGVRVRVIGCGTTANMGIDELAGSAVHVLVGPNSTQRQGIMHNKFIIFDAESANANDPIVWTGSTNLTDDQVNLDANNVIIVQDQSLARTYQIEFEEMWGSHSDTPNEANAKFGAEKKNNTPHAFRINGKFVEAYFSPTDGVNAKIVETINSANHDLSVATMLITRIEMGDAIVSRAGAGIAANVITNSQGGNNTTVNAILTEALSTHFTFDNVSSGILHHKYMIVDQGAPASDPILWTGSHNWSAAADNENDENTLVIHDATIANIYYQEFVKRFVDNQGVLSDLNTPPVAVADNAIGVIDELLTVAVLNNDEIQAPVTLSIENSATHGLAYIPFANPNVISYQPETGFYGEDSIVYKIAYQADATLYSTAKAYFTIVNNSGVNELSSIGTLKVMPNPATATVHIPLIMNNRGQATLTITDMQGKTVYSARLSGNEKDVYLNLDGLRIQSGIYLIVLKDQQGISANRLVVY